MFLGSFLGHVFGLEEPDFASVGHIVLAGLNGSQEVRGLHVGFQGFLAGEGLEDDVGLGILGVLVPVVPDDSWLLPGELDDLLDLRPVGFENFGLDFEGGDEFDLGHKIRLNYMK